MERLGRHRDRATPELQPSGARAKALAAASGALEGHRTEPQNVQPYLHPNLNLNGVRSDRTDVILSFPGWAGIVLTGLSQVDPKEEAKDKFKEKAAKAEHDAEIKKLTSRVWAMQRSDRCRTLPTVLSLLRRFLHHL